MMIYFVHVWRGRKGNRINEKISRNSFSIFRTHTKKQKPKAEINNLIRRYISNGRHVRQATAKGEICVAKPDCFL